MTKYTAVAFAYSGIREYSTDSLVRARKKAIQWIEEEDVRKGVEIYEGNKQIGYVKWKKGQYIFINTIFRDYDTYLKEILLNKNGTIKK